MLMVNQLIGFGAGGGAPNVIISGGTGTNIGDMTSNAGLAGAFDGSTNVSNPSCAALTSDAHNYVGKNYSASPKQIFKAIVYSSNNLGYTNNGAVSVTLALRGKQTAPSSAADAGSTLLGSTTFTNSAAALNTNTVDCTDQFTAWNYVWIDIVAGGAAGQTKLIGEIEFYGG